VAERQSVGQLDKRERARLELGNRKRTFALIISSISARWPMPVMATRSAISSSGPLDRGLRLTGTVQGVAHVREPFFGVSLKMYFGYAETVDWCERVATMAQRLPALAKGQVELSVFPTFAALSAAVGAFAGTPVKVGAQDLFWEDGGPFTGEVSGSELRELGCRFVEVGHAERRRYFGETNEIVARKLAAADRNGLTPVLCVGEDVPGCAEAAALWCCSQVASALESDSRHDGGVVVAYEPVWAIGAEAPASTEHIRVVCAAIRDWLQRTRKLRRCRVIYGGSAGPGLLTELGDSVDGLFLGRFAHDTSNLERVIGEISTGRT
jgi:triosephosphate isomerase